VSEVVHATPLGRKLGLAEGQDVLFVGAPDGFAGLLGELPAGVRVRRRATRAALDLIVFFTTSRAQLEARLGALHRALRPAGRLWIAWPKRASGVPSDVSDTVVRDVALPTGLVDTKVCAIDETWSGLRLVIRRELR
jgi:hypothetical protein